MKLSDINIDKLSPMMKQYAEIKKEYENELLFFRLGDFYELFFEDAIIAAKELELTLTGKVAGLSDKIPMCGVPHHAVKSYLEKIVNKGYKVAICEQLEDPKDVKGIVKRGVVSVISKATIADFELLDDKKSVYIASILAFSNFYLLTYLDISSTKLFSSKIKREDDLLINEILTLNIQEVILLNNENTSLINILKNNYSIEINFSNEYLEKDLPLFIEREEDNQIKLGLKHIYYYLKVKLLKNLDYINNVTKVNKLEYLEMDVHTIRNLELVETIRLKDRVHSLFWLLDKCDTSMGSRKLKEWLLNPLVNIDLINNRYDYIEILNTEFILKSELINLLKEIYDLERLTGKVVNGSINGRDLLQLKNSLKPLPDIKNIVEKLGFKYQIDIHQDLFNLLESSINEDAPFTIKEGGIIKEGFNKELDELKEIRRGGKKFIASFEKEIKEKTKIKNIKIGFNKVFGYYIEVSKGSIKDIKPEFGFERRQTLTNAERYISPELKEKESLILNAEDKINKIEYDLFMEIKEHIEKEIIKLNETADIISIIDAITSLSKCSEAYSLVRPKLNNNQVMEIIDSRHPVLEVVSKDLFIPNDIFMDKNSSTLLLTGPNMSGKSTYMRQTALMVIMAQMGSFVPAKAANISIVDKIFTRIGASDDLVAGESTFMVEMKEARYALDNATENSLILFDELGRGTATYDGMAIAKAILEYISLNIKCFTIFSTHYHELTLLDKKLSNIKNVHVSAEEEGNDLIFLHKVKNGSVDKSYGIHVAKLAKLPNSLIKRADEILGSYENNKKPTKNDNKLQLELSFMETNKESAVNDLIDEINPFTTTPMEALNILIKLKELKEKEDKNE